MQKQTGKTYQAFLLRCWLIRPATADALPVWRFELQEVSAEPQTHRFSDFEQLGNFMFSKLKTDTDDED